MQPMTAQAYLKHAKEMWQTLVPKNGHAATYSGELLRCLENLRDEAQRNGNINWGQRHAFKAYFIQKQLIEAKLFSATTSAQIQQDIAQMLHYEVPVTEEALYDRLMHRIVDWDLHQKERLPLSKAFLAQLAEHDDSAFEGGTTTPPDNALGDAILVQDVTTVQALLAAGIDLEQKDEFGGTVLGGAAAVGNIEILQVLLEAGANINHVDNLGQSVLDMATYRPAAQKFLTSKGAKSGKTLP